MADKIAPEFIQDLPRHKKLAGLRNYYESKQYEGRPDFFTGQRKNGDVVPLRERKPCIIYPLPRAAVNQVVRFTFGENRFPTVRLDKIDDDNTITGEKLSEEEAKTLETYIANVIDRCHLKPGMRQVMRPGVATGTVCVMLSVKTGLVALRVANAEDCQATFRDNDPTQAVLAITWAYQFQQTVAGPDGRPEQKRFWYRLDVDAIAFTEYLPVEFKPNEKPIWVAGKPIEHGFGFCPALWIRNVEDEDHGDIDGQSLYEGLLEEFDALNFALSQRHRGINFWGVPQPWEAGVDEDDGPNATGRTTSSGFSPAGTDDESPHGMTASVAAQKIGPDHMRTYRSKDVTLELLETTGKAFESCTLHVNDVRTRCLETMSVVLVNVSEIMGRTAQGQMSAKFLELAYEPLLALVDEMRHCWWPNGLQALLSMILRITAVLDGKGLWIPGALKAAKLLNRFSVETDVGVVWLPPQMTPAWGDYFSPDPDEVAKDIASAVAAQGLVPDDDRARYVLPYFDRHDITEALEELEEDREEAEAAATAKAQNEALALHALANGTDPNAPPPKGPIPGGPAGGKPKKGARGRAARALAAKAASGGE